MAQKDRIITINEERKAQGLTYRQIADMSNLSSSTVYRALTGQTMPDEATLEKMEAALGIPELLFADPVVCKNGLDPLVERYINVQENRITRLKAHYNMLLANKNRWLVAMFTTTLSLILLYGGATWYDATHKDRGWIRD